MLLPAVTGFGLPELVTLKSAWVPDATAMFTVAELSNGLVSFVVVVAVMEHIGCQQRDSAVMVFVVIPREKALAKAPRVFDGPESVGELGPVLESFELALRVRVIV